MTPSSLPSFLTIILRKLFAKSHHITPWRLPHIDTVRSLVDYWMVVLASLTPPFTSLLDILEQHYHHHHHHHHQEQKRGNGHIASIPTFVSDTVSLQLAACKCCHNTYLILIYYGNELFHPLCFVCALGEDLWYKDLDTGIQASRPFLDILKASYISEILTWIAGCYYSAEFQAMVLCNYVSLGYLPCSFCLLNFPSDSIPFHENHGLVICSPHYV